MPWCVGQQLPMRSTESAFARPKAIANSETPIFAQQQQSKSGLGTPTQCISNSQSELFHPAEDPSYFQECHFLSCMKLQREREISFQTSIINQSLYRNPSDQNSRLLRYYGASHKFSAVRKTPARHGKVRRLKCDAGSWVFVISLTGTCCGTGTL